MTEHQFRYVAESVSLGNVPEGEDYDTLKHDRYTPHAAATQLEAVNAAQAASDTDEAYMIRLERLDRRYGWEVVEYIDGYTPDDIL